MKKNRDFFYLQYNKINWKNQEKTKINFFINSYIIKEVLLKKSPKNSIAVFDIGFGIGLFFKMMSEAFGRIFEQIYIEGCEPSKVNYEHFEEEISSTFGKIPIITHNERFLDIHTSVKFDFMTAIYVFPHFLFEELQKIVEKVHQMLNENGQFILVVANEKYLQEKLDSEKDLFIESSEVEFDDRLYKEVLHYSDIPEIGKIIDYNREERFYVDLFQKNGFKLKTKKDINDNGFICTLFVFQK